MENSNPLVITNEAYKSLLSSSKWAKFLAIIGFIGIGLTVVFGLLTSISMSTMIEKVPSDNPLFYINGGFIAVIYLVTGFAFLFPLIALYKYASKINRGLQVRDQLTIDSAFDNLRKFFKYYGILIIVFLSIYLILFLVLIFTLPFAI